MPLSGFPTGTVSKPNDRTYPASDTRQPSSRHPQRDTDAEETNRRLPQRSTPDLVSQPSDQPSVVSTPTMSPRERLEAVEERLGRLEAELERRESDRTIVDCRGGRTTEGRTVERRTVEGRIAERRTPRRRKRKPLRNRNDDRNLLPKKDRFEWLLPKQNENLLRKLFWP